MGSSQWNEAAFVDGEFRTPGGGGVLSVPIMGVAKTQQPSGRRHASASCCVLCRSCTFMPAF